MNSTWLRWPLHQGAYTIGITPFVSPKKMRKMASCKSNFLIVDFLMKNMNLYTKFIKIFLISLKILIYSIHIFSEIFNIFVHPHNNYTKPPLPYRQRQFFILSQVISGFPPHYGEFPVAVLSYLRTSSLPEADNKNPPECAFRTDLPQNPISMAPP